MLPDFKLNCRGSISECHVLNGIYKTNISMNKYNLELFSRKTLGSIGQFLTIKINNESIEVSQENGEFFTCFEVFFFANFK